MEQFKLCFLCRQKATVNCDRCGRISSCSPDHLKVHHLGPKKCSPFRIDYREGIGNCMIATRDIGATELILKEAPAVWGPKNKSLPVCLECMSPCLKLKQNVSQVESSFLEDNFCNNCGFPVCDDECSRGKRHQVECPIFAYIPKQDLPSFKEPCPEYSAVIPLRILALKQSNPELWSRVDLLMDHVADMKEDEKKMWQVVTVKFLKEKCKLQSYSEDELFRAIGIFLTNGVNQGIFNSQGLYPTFSFISHSCICNSRFQIQIDRTLILRAQRDIKEGEEITTRYLPALMGSIRRRFKIKNNWTFDCACDRCKDPTEMNTYHGATLCQKCVQQREDCAKEEVELNLADLFQALLAKNRKKASSIQPDVNQPKDAFATLVATNPLEYFSTHVCSTCQSHVDGLTIFALTKALEEEADQCVTWTIEEVKKGLERFQKALHPNHYLVIQLKKRLLDQLALEMGSIEDVHELRDTCEKIVQYGQDILKVVEVLEPGYSLAKGRLLKLMHLPRLKLAEIKLKSKEISKQEFMEVVKVSIRNTKTAVKCLEDFQTLDEEPFH